MSDKVDLTKKSWDPDDPELSSDMCAFEGNAVQRMIWNRCTREFIAETLNMNLHEVNKRISVGWCELRVAWRNNRPVYNGVYNPGFGVGYDH